MRRREPHVREPGACSRRSFLRLAGAAAVAGGPLLLVGCGGGQRGPTVAEQAGRYDPGLDCTDTSGLWPAEVETRTNNEYADRSPHEDRFCFNCTNFIPPEEDGACGRCDTVKGPINPLGWCTAWTERRG